MLPSHSVPASFNSSIFQDTREALVKMTAKLDRMREENSDTCFGGSEKQDHHHEQVEDAQGSGATAHKAMPNEQEPITVKSFSELLHEHDSRMSAPFVSTARVAISSCGATVDLDEDQSIEYFTDSDDSQNSDSEEMVPGPTTKPGKQDGNPINVNKETSRAANTWDQPSPHDAYWSSAVPSFSTRVKNMRKLANRHNGRPGAVAVATRKHHDDACEDHDDHVPKMRKLTDGQSPSLEFWKWSVGRVFLAYPARYDTETKKALYAISLTDGKAFEIIDKFIMECRKENVNDAHIFPTVAHVFAFLTPELA